MQPIASIARSDDAGAAAEFDLLKTHAELGCVSLWCTSDGRVYPFAFLPRRIGKGLVPVVQLVYCRDQQDFMPILPGRSAAIWRDMAGRWSCWMQPARSPA